MAFFAEIDFDPCMGKTLKQHAQEKYIGWVKPIFNGISRHTTRIYLYPVSTVQLIGFKKSVHLADQNFGHPLDVQCLAEINRTAQARKRITFPLVSYFGELTMHRDH